VFLSPRSHLGAVSLQSSPRSDMGPRGQRKKVQLAARLVQRPKIELAAGPTGRARWHRPSSRARDTGHETLCHQMQSPEMLQLRSHRNPIGSTRIAKPHQNRNGISS